MLQLKRVGVTEASQMKNHLRDFEKYMAENHGVVVETRKKTFQDQGSILSVYHPFAKGHGGK